VIHTAQRCNGGTGGGRAPLALCLSMWLTEKKVGNQCCLDGLWVGVRLGVNGLKFCIVGGEQGVEG
jgi:hypothetical protein